jgi:alpha-L-arabinofuranosidase
MMKNIRILFFIIPISLLLLSTQAQNQAVKIGFEVETNRTSTITQLPHVLNLDAASTPIHPGIRGVALADMTLERGSWKRGIPDSLAVSRGSSIRGVAGGLYADLYDWRTRTSCYHSLYKDNTQPRPTTLEFLRWARDYNAELFITANTRGLVLYDAKNIGKVCYYTSDTQALARLAADWVRYANHIVPNYRKGDSITDPRDRKILDSLVWSSSFPGDSFDKLLSPDEKPVPHVTYWEIGNEPTVSVAGSIGVSNGYRLSATEYAERYKAIALAMKAEDPAIKIGPCLVNGSGKNAVYITTLLSDPTVPVDFISYHPYQNLGKKTTPKSAQAYLGTIYDNQYKRWNDIREAIKAAGRNPDNIEMVASEVNVSGWRFNETMKEGEMAHALGSLETVFAFSRLGLFASHYWIWPADADYGTPYPVYKVYEKLRDYMGDRLIDFYEIGNKVHVYTTRDSRNGNIATWALNFQNTKELEMKLSIKGLPDRMRMKRFTLKNIKGITTLASGNYSGNRTGGPRNEVDWEETDFTDINPRNLEFTIEPATISLILLEMI